MKGLATGAGRFLLLLILGAAQISARAQESGAPGGARAENIELYGSSWPSFRGDSRNTGVSASGQPGGKPWTRATTWKGFWGSPGFGADGTLYVIADGLYAFDGASGKQKWHFYVPNSDGAGIA